MKNENQNFWLIVGAIVLVMLLLVWLTFAFLGGDTDVTAGVKPLASSVYNA